MRVPRRIKNKDIKKKTFKKIKFQPPKNISLEIILIKIIFPYSAIKIKANSNPPYSILNPDTSSDSPSERSNGVRLVSAKIEKNHIKNKIKNLKK